MNIILAKSAGFCFGVKRAVETVYKEAEKNQTPIYTFGPIIHNEEVVADLEKKGVQVIHSTDELKGRPKGTVIIRSHGVERKIYDEIKALGFLSYNLHIWYCYNNNYGHSLKNFQYSRPARLFSRLNC